MVVLHEPQVLHAGDRTCKATWRTFLKKTISTRQPASVSRGFAHVIPDHDRINCYYYVSLNQEFLGAQKLYTKGRVECFSDKSRFRLRKQQDMSEGDTLHFYLVGHRKAGNFQMERVYENNDEILLEFQKKPERGGLEKDGSWYQLDKLEENFEKLAFGPLAEQAASVNLQQQY
ncbi:hypothetical protein J6590_049480, partial [Homalodisca vitripennis]